MALEAEIAARLCASLDGVSAQLFRREDYLREISEGVTNPETPAISFTGSIATPYVPLSWGPTFGYRWYIQLVTVGPLASGDTLAIYRGRSPSDNVGQRLKNQFTGSNGAWQAWHPGRTGMVLVGGRDGLVFDGGSGTLTSATRYYVNVDVIQVADRQLAQFLM
jgi:hypothetical protein